MLRNHPIISIILHHPIQPSSPILPATKERHIILILIPIPLPFPLLKYPLQT